MPNYQGQSCVSCSSPFKDGDDIVVCPQCGSPYHRECYKKEGGCINTSLHEQGEGWTPIDTKNQESCEDSAKAHKTAVCRVCGQENSAEAPFCSKCGAPINMEKASGSFYEQMKNENGRQSGQPFFTDFGIPLFGSERYTLETDLDGNTAGEYTSYVGNNWIYFIPKFMRFAKRNRVSFNFSAFIFPHLYFFYRKMIPEGVLMLIGTILTSIPSTLFTFIEMGYLPSLSYILDSPLFQNIYLISSFLFYALSLAAGVFANWLYYRKAKREIAKIKEKGQVLAAGDSPMLSSPKNEAIRAAGGTSVIYLAFAAVAYMILSLLVILVPML